MTNNEILQAYYPLVKKCIHFQMNKLPKLDKELKNDLEQEICLIMLSYNNDKLNMIHNQKHMNAFITGILRNQLHSSTSPFYRSYLKLKNNSISLDDLYSL